MTTITTPEGIAYFQLVQLRARLKLEIATGMKHSGGSTLAIVNQTYGHSFKRKQAALDWINQKIADTETGAQMSQQEATT